jgi:hypothetical protein
VDRSGAGHPPRERRRRAGRAPGRAVAAGVRCGLPPRSGRGRDSRCRLPAERAVPAVAHAHRVAGATAAAHARALGRRMWRDLWCRWRTGRASKTRCPAVVSCVAVAPAALRPPGGGRPSAVAR